MSPTPMHLAVALDGAGWHPAAWREPDARPRELLTAGYWLDLVQEAERGLLDLVTLEDGLALQSADPYRPDDRTDQVRGRLDAVLVASRVAPLTEHIGLVPTAIVTHTEPFHVSKAIATLDYVSTGRAGVQVRVSLKQHEARLFGRRSFPPVSPSDPAAAPLIQDAFAEAADYVEVLRRLWDSWEDDAEIRDVATGRFVDREKLHYIDFEGREFSVRGPSITPRPPQGQPVVAALAHQAVPFELVGSSADLGFVTPRDAAHAEEIVAEIRCAQTAAGREEETVHVFGDLVVFLDEDEATARDRQGAARRPRGRGVPQRRHRVHRHAGRPRRPARRVADRRPERLPPPPRRPAARPDRHHPGPGARAAAARPVPHRLRGGHPARAAGAAPPRQPLRRAA